MKPGRVTVPAVMPQGRSTRALAVAPGASGFASGVDGTVAGDGNGAGLESELSEKYLGDRARPVSRASRMLLKIIIHRLRLTRPAVFHHDRGIACAIGRAARRSRDIRPGRQARPLEPGGREDSRRGEGCHGSVNVVRSGQGIRMTHRSDNGRPLLRAGSRRDQCDYQHASEMQSKTRSDHVLNYQGIFVPLAVSHGESNVTRPVSRQSTCFFTVLCVTSSLDKHFS